MRRNTSLRLRMWWRSANGSNGALDREQPVPCRQRNDPLAMNKRHCAQGREEPNARSQASFDRNEGEDVR
jgi:hypothetical protein